MTRNRDPADDDAAARSDASAVPLPQLAAADPQTDQPPRRRYGRWRAATLIGIHVLAAVHIAHWRLAGKTLAPLELNEVMHTLELGIVTAGFVFMALIVVSVALFGRFFCSWGCHILALQDLCSWLLRKLRLRVKPVRSRVLLLVAPGAMLYMFVWPQVSRLIGGRAIAPLHVQDDTSGWASFVTDDFWRNLPGPGITLLTFAVCGFAVVYFLGTRSFCQHACPYGVIFGIMDRFAPGRIKVDPDKCKQCGTCTGVCESHVRIHEEIARHGCVVDPSCLKDLDCVGACPEQALSFGWTRPSLQRSLRPARRRLRYDFTLREDLLMAAIFLASLATFRGLYGIVPFLLSLAIGGILAYLAVLCLRLLSKENVRLNAFQLKLKGQVTQRGAAFVLLAALVWGFVIHSGLVRYHDFQGRRALSRATAIYHGGDDAEAVEAAAREALGHFRFCDRWGLLTAPGHHARVASASWAVGDIDGAERSWRAAIEQTPEEQSSRLDLAASLLRRGRADLAVPVLREVTAAREQSEKDAARYAHQRASAWMMLGSLAAGRGELASAVTAFEAAAAERPGHAAPHLALAELRGMAGDLEGAASSLRKVIEIDPHNTAALNNLAIIEESLGR
ncbi:MAG: tetratricopeptide repeat protein [Planctomycetota bacterium]|jgi:polyferredoxin/Flp pilus assembly protein TadD